eukprot:6399036-Amphidinium_carterae.1
MRISDPQFLLPVIFSDVMALCTALFQVPSINKFSPYLRCCIITAVRCCTFRWAYSARLCGCSGGLCPCAGNLSSSRALMCKFPMTNWPVCKMGIEIATCPHEEAVLQRLSMLRIAAPLTMG